MMKRDNDQNKKDTLNRGKYFPHLGASQTIHLSAKYLKMYQNNIKIL